MGNSLQLSHAHMEIKKTMLYQRSLLGSRLLQILLWFLGKIETHLTLSKKI